MESESNTKLLKQMTKRERKPTSTSKRLNAIKAGSNPKKNEQVQEQKVKSTTFFPGASYLKSIYQNPSTTSVIVFGIACIAIIKYGDKMSEAIDSNFPTEKKILAEMKAQQDAMMMM